MKKITSLIITVAMVMSMFSMTAFAATGSVEYTTGADTMTFVTQLNMSKDAVTAPSTEFTYAIAVGQEDEGNNVYAGVNTASVGIAVFLTADKLAQDTNNDNNYFEKKVTVDFSAVQFPASGIYHYVITATANTDKGIIMDSDSDRDVYVYVTEEKGTRSIAEIIMTTDAIQIDANNGVTNKSDRFTNSYGVDGTPGKPGKPDEPGKPGDDPSHNLLVSKTVTGAMGDKSQEFTFDLTACANVLDGTIFKVTDQADVVTYIAWSKDGFVKATKGANDEVTIGTDAATFTLADSETYKITSVIEDMSFTVEETAAAGYTTTVAVDGAEGSEVLSAVNAIDVAEGNDTTAFTNEYKGDIPTTSVILTILPFVLMVLLAAAFLAIRVTATTRKSRR